MTTSELTHATPGARLLARLWRWSRGDLASDAGLQKVCYATHRRWNAIAVTTVAALFTPHLVLTAGAQAGALPFNIGERMVYRARVASLGTVGRGTMWVEGPVMVRGVATMLLRFDMRAGFGPVKGTDRTSSWLDATRMTSLRFAKRERSPVANYQEEVDIYPEEATWRSAGGASGETPSNRSLDELSFIYYIRTLPLAAEAVYRLDRHFDSARNPTTVTVIRRERVVTAAGDFQTILVEMRVRDPRRYKKNEGVVRINITDDSCRVPVRITSLMRVLGTVVLTLESYVAPARSCGESLAAGPLSR